jgi:hypothetical protein
MIAYLMIFIGAFLRVVPHAANFAPIGAIALFGSVYLDRRQALIVPVLAMAISDIFIGFDSLPSRLEVYGSFLLIGLLGFYVRKHKSLAVIAAGSLASSLIFFLVTNFAFFYPLKMYSHDLEGVVASYTAGLPFLKNTILSDLLYTAAFFGGYELVLARKKSLASAKPTIL